MLAAEIMRNPSLPVQRSEVWWLDPAKFLALITLPVFLLCVLYSQEISDEYRFSNFIDFTSAALGVGCIGLMILGCRFGQIWTRTYRQVDYDERNYVRALTALTCLSIFAHLVLLGGILVRYDLVIAAMAGSQGAIYEVKANMQKIEGVTSFSQVYLFVYPLCAAYKPIFGRSLPKTPKTLAWALIALILIRSFVILERLAIVEAVIVYSVVALFYIRVDKVNVAMMPLVGGVGVYILFAAGEFTRSWAYNEANSESFISYVNIRLLGYIEIAINNGAAVLELVGPLNAPYFTAAWLRKLPIWGGAYPFVDGNPMEVVFDGFGSAEFNNPGGIMSGLLDYGYFSPLYYLAIGFFSGALHKMFCERRPFGLVFFPGWFLGFVVLTQANYWGDPRFFLVTLLAPFLANYIRKK